MHTYKLINIQEMMNVFPQETDIMNDYTTRIETLSLIVPRTPDGEFSPSVFERYQRSEKELLASMLEMYVKGVSRRKVSKGGLKSIVV